MTISAVVVLNLQSFVPEPAYSRFYPSNVEIPSIHCEAEAVVKQLRAAKYVISPTLMESVWTAQQGPCKYAIVRVENGQTYMWHLAGASGAVQITPQLQTVLVSNVEAVMQKASSANLQLLGNLHTEVQLGSIRDHESKYLLWQLIKTSVFCTDQVRQVLRPLQRQLVTPIRKGKRR